MTRAIQVEQGMQWGEQRKVSMVGIKERRRI